MNGLKFTKEHEWIRVDGETGTVGITDYAQEQLGDVVHVELPEVGSEVPKMKEVAVIDSVKAASEIYAPVAGEILAVNDALADDFGKVNSDPLGDGWLFKIKIADPADLEGLMDEKAYEAFLAEQH